MSETLLSSSYSAKSVLDGSDYDETDDQLNYGYTFLLSQLAILFISGAAERKALQLHIHFNTIGQLFWRQTWSLKHIEFGYVDRQAWPSHQYVTKWFGV